MASCPLSDKETQKFTQACSVAKIMASVSWDRKGVLSVYFLPRGETIMQLHIAQHSRGYGILFKTTDRAYSLAECDYFMTVHKHTLQS
jgi:hypothetical protein